jgi:hypothetical protein
MTRQLVIKGLCRGAGSLFVPEGLVLMTLLK